MADSQRRRTVLVTGGASGIGAAVAAAFAALGDRVTVFDRAAPGDVATDYVTGDVTSVEDTVRAVRAAAPEGALDVLVANAGVHDGGLAFNTVAIDEVAARLRRVLEVNLVGYALSVEASAAALRSAGGAVILTLSDASFDVMGNGSGLAYVAAKHGALGLMRAAARDLAPRVRVNAVAPGGVATGLVATTASGTRRLIDDPQALAERLAARALLGRGASLEQMASAYVYLASAPAAGITGQVLRVDGGRLS